MAILEESANVIEFTNDKKIVLYKDGKSFWGTVTVHGELNCQIARESKMWYTFSALDGEDFFFKGRIEIINNDRIRIYLLKHHDILDLADEYHRTNDFSSYQTILSGIVEEPE